MQRLSEFAKETCLSFSDLLRLTEDIVDVVKGVVVPGGGRKKTGAEQISPLTIRARKILGEIKRERRSGGVANVMGWFLRGRTELH
jgi:integrase